MATLVINAEIAFGERKTGERIVTRGFKEWNFQEHSKIYKILWWEDLGPVKRWMIARKLLYSVSALAGLQI